MVSLHACTRAHLYHRPELCQVIDWHHGAVTGQTPASDQLERNCSDGPRCHRGLLPNSVSAMLHTLLYPYLT